MAMRAVNLKIYAGLSIAACGLFAIATISNTIARSVEALPPATTAGLATSIPVTMVSICGFASFGIIGAAAVFVIWRTPRPAHRQQRDDEPQMIVQSPRPAQIATPTLRQLPAPMPPTEPRFAAYRGDIAAQIQREQQRATHVEHGPDEAEFATFTSDYAQYQPQYDDVPPIAPNGPESPQMVTNERIIARLGDGQEISIASAAWLAFASMQKPNRDQWRQQLTASGNSAPNADYSKCKQIAESYKLLSGAGCWISPKMRDNVTQWLTQP